MNPQYFHQTFGACRRLLGCVGVAAALVQLSACATYYNHYGSFQAETAGGDVREFRISWLSADYPDWWLASDYSTPIKLESQCSERVLEFLDRNQTKHGAVCATESQNVAWCGDPKQDLAMDGGPFSGETHLCGWVANAGGGTDGIPNLGSQLEINIHCWPVKTSEGKGDNKRVFDYLKASTVPYSVAVKTVERYSAQDNPMRLNDKICKLEE